MVLPSPRQEMLRLLAGSWVSQVIRGAAATSLAEKLASGPKKPEDIAQDGVLHSSVAFRFLRACAAIGLVEPMPNGSFASTPLLDTLKIDDPGSLHGLAMFRNAPVFWLPWGRFVDALATGRRQAVEALGAETFDYLALQPDQAADFSRAMTGLTAIVVEEVARSLDTSPVKHAVDVGGAEGALLHGLMKSNPHLSGTLFDKPGTVERARQAAQRAGVERRLDIVGGDFFVEVPTGDLYLLKYILHDWDDRSCSKILRNCREAAAPGARIAVVELALGEPGEGDWLAPLLDLSMMVALSGRERTPTEYAKLLENAGFTNVRTTPIANGMLLIEADAS